MRGSCLQLFRFVSVFFCLILAACGSGGGGGGSSGGSTTTPLAMSRIFITGKSLALDHLFVSYANSNFTSGALSPDRTVTGINTKLNEPRGIAMDLANDRLYVANFYGNSILVFDNASQTSGDIGPAREIVGANTLLNNPISLFLDTAHDRLYVSNFSLQSQNVLVFDNVSQITGDVAPSRVISGFVLYSYSLLSGIFVDTTRDILYVVDFNGHAIYIFDGAQFLSGTVTASRIIFGNQTKILAAHGVIVDSVTNQLILANYGGSPGSILIFDNASTTSGNVAPSRKITSTDPDFTPSTTVLDTLRNRLYVVNASVSKLEIIENISTVNGTITPDVVANLSGVLGPTGLFVDTR